MAKKTALPVTARLGSPRRPNRWMTAARPPPRPSSSGAGGVGGVAGRGGGVASPTDGADGRGIPVVGGGSGGGPRKWALKEARAVRRGVAALAVLTAACATLLYVLAVAPEGGGDDPLMAAAGRGRGGGKGEGVGVGAGSHTPVTRTAMDVEVPVGGGQPHPTLWSRARTPQTLRRQARLPLA